MIGLLVVGRVERVWDLVDDGPLTVRRPRGVDGRERRRVKGVA